MKYILIFILLFFLQSEGFANPKVVQTEGNLLLQDNQISTFTDYSNSLPFSKVKNFKNVFRHASAHFPDFGFSNQTHWLKFTLQNRTQENNIFIKVNNPNLNWLRLYYPVNNKGNYKFVEGGNLFPASRHKFGDQDNIFSVPLPIGQTRTFFLKIKSYAHIAVPISAGSQEQMIDKLNNEHWQFGLFFGAILIILLFNFVIYLVLKDKAYLYYVLYIFFLGFFLFSVYGYGYKFFWSNQPLLTLQSISIPKILMGITMVLFLRQFLQTQKTLPLFDTIGKAILILCVALIPVSLFGLYNISLILIDIFLLLICIIYFIAGIKLYKKDFKPAKYFMLAWSVLFIGLFIDIFKDMNIIPYTHFTRDAFLICADIEMILLSFALADKINIHKAGEISAEKKALKLAQEKEQLIAMENIRLETKVKNRTLRLTQSNEKLEEAMTSLQATQNKLVHAEKLASIGKLTAGIAHEINNPISYIKTNVSALKKDINDLLELIGKYQKLNADNLSTKMKEIDSFINEIELEFTKEEINTLIDGIKEGVSHTSDIVLGLRKFSRMDEDSFEKMDIHESLDSALRFVRSMIPNHIKILKDYDNIGNINSSPGPLCQVFVNILTNGIQAITLKETATSEKEKIIITTKKVEELVEITIADTGPGICEEHKMNIFDPFFTTKEVGKGTGLGLSISYGIIKKLNGDIRVSSSLGKGTAFTIALPVNHAKEVFSK